jgi:hypothetical protein
MEFLEAILIFILRFFFLLCQRKIKDLFNIHDTYFPRILSIFCARGKVYLNILLFYYRIKEKKSGQNNGKFARKIK